MPSPATVTPASSPVKARTLDAAVVARARALPAGRGRPDWYRIGDVALGVTTDSPGLRDELGRLFGDCRMERAPDDLLRLTCRVQPVPDSPCLLLAFDGPPGLDPLEAARGAYRFRRTPPYVDAPGPLPGWRQLVSAGPRPRGLIATDGHLAVVNLEEAPPELVVETLIGVAVAIPTGVLFLHAGSVGVAGSGGLLLGSTGGGKSTTALAMAAQGHLFLGDDLAAVRVASGEVLPFPKSAGLRDGPLADALADRVARVPHVVSPGRFGLPRTVVRISDLFPGRLGGPLPLRFAFVLDGFSTRASTAPFHPGLGELTRLKSVVTETTASWGRSPGRDLLNFLAVVNLLKGLSCHVVKLGTPEETARLIAGVMEAACN